MSPLDPRYVQLQREAGRYLTAALSVALLAAGLIGLGVRRWYWTVPLWMAATAVLALVLHRWAAVDYRARGYRLDADGIEIRQGVYWRAVMNVPRSRVQHTDVTQGPLERKYGLGRVVIYTAGTEHSRVELPGLEHGTALAVRDQLLPRQSADVV